MILIHLRKFKNWVVWSWTYLWAFWFLLVVFVLYYLRGPLKISENIGMATMFLSTLTPKFYVALTGTSSLISGLILIFEWWYYRKYGTSFIEQVSLNHLGPLLGPQDYNGNTNGEANGNATSPSQTQSTQVMQTAWRERNPQERVNGAKAALEKNPDCATAYILLAEEDACTIVESEKLLKQAMKAAESNLRKSQLSQPHGGNGDNVLRRDINVLIYIKRRLAMCARKLGRLKEAVKMFRDLTKEVQPIMSVLHVHENLIEALLEMQAYADVQAVLAKYDDGSVPRSAALCYTSALLKVRQVSEKFMTESGLIKRSLSASEMNAIEAIHRAVEYNPHVPKYLLELKPMVFPPEHLLKRGDSEAVCYVFFHLQHWKRVDGALQLLACTWEGTFASIPRPLEKGNLFFPYPPCTECPDREILPAHHEVSVFPERETPFFIMFTAGLCTFTALIAFLTHQYPDQMAIVAKTVVGWMSLPVIYIMDKLENLLPASFLQILSRV
ncbi:Suppressor of tumorigenicity 7 protein [Folsomia candida]|uniref:Protein ST7 homolog n=1 Tax=Folsomia candida TaxID=158441 RepID=A0A226DNL7_FOLCA|nr:Suppressor of tumorigenicity 7 protein [Folsomia candida]